MNKEIKKISADNVCDKTIISNKIEQAKNLIAALQDCVDVINLLDDCNLHDQLTTADDAMQSNHHMVKRLEEVHGDFHMLTDEARSAEIKKWAVANRG